VTLIPEMAVAVETRSAPVSVTRFRDPQPARIIGMVWRKTSPLAGQLRQLSEMVCRSANALREQRTLGSSSRNPRNKRQSGGRSTPNSRAPRRKSPALRR
jgi:LysR family hydrogen peroxide-inducible transcriptional activator